MEDLAKSSRTTDSALLPSLPAGRSLAAPILSPLPGLASSRSPPPTSLPWITQPFSGVLPLQAPSSDLPCKLSILTGYREEFIDTLHYRFGFLCEDYGDAMVISDEVEDGDVHTEDIAKTLRQAMRTFIAHHDELTVRYHRCFLTFCERLSREGGPNPPSWDLDDSNPRHLCRPSTSNDHTFSIDTLLSKNASVLYHVKPPMQQEFSVELYHLLVPTASTAVECYRRSFPNITFAAQHLVDCGKSFRIFMNPKRPKKYPRPTPPILPHPENSRPFMHYDFVAYERVRERFFQHPHARAALLEGGIIWRLAMEHLDSQDALRGPSDSANDFGDSISLPNGTELVDDSLTDDERDLICGTYIIYTGLLLGSSNAA